MSAAPARAGQSRVSLLGRFAAWWEGVEAAPEVELPAASSPGQPKPAAKPPGPQVDLLNWSADRLEAAQQIYGPGWLSAGGEPLYAELMKCLLLDATHTVVVHGAGLSGFASLLARETDAWIEAQEEDPLLAAEGARLVKTAGLAKKVVALTGPLQSCGVKPHSRQAAVSCEQFYRVKDKKAQLAALCGMLKPGGQLLLTDFVLKGGDAEAIGRWARCEAGEPHFMKAGELKALLQSQGMDVRICEDRTQDYCRAALGALQELLRQMESAPVRQGLRGWLVWEIEVLTQKLQALDSGAIGFQRAFALVPSQKVER